MRAVSLVIGVVFLVGTTFSIVRTMVIPRATPSFAYAATLRATDGVFNGLMRLRRNYASRDRVLAWSGAVGIIAALFSWLLLFLVSYIFIIVGISDSTFSSALQQAGSALFTLGIVGTPGEALTVVDFLAAMTGPAVIALLIGFLPTLYQSYLSRESRVLLNAGFAGSPAWGPELLVRVKLIEGDVDIKDVYSAWIEWSAQVRLTQTLYPSLNRFRSAVGNRNWIMSLLGVLDAAAMHIAISRGEPDPTTIALLEQGSQAMLSIDATEVDIDRILRLSGVEQRWTAMMDVFGVRSKQAQPAPDDFRLGDALPEGVRAVSRAITIDNLKGRMPGTAAILIDYEGRQSTLPREDFDHALDYLRSAGIAINRAPDDAYAIFRALRGRYEGSAYRLAQRFYAPRAPWSGTRSPVTPVVWPALAGELQGK